MPLAASLNPTGEQIFYFHKCCKSATKEKNLKRKPARFYFWKTPVSWPGQHKIFQRRFTVDSSCQTSTWHAS